jgi:uncharacterized protein (TIGR02001 family)
MKKIVSPLMFAMALASAGTAMAQTAPAAPESSLSFNVGAVSEYRYYVGVWGSGIKWVKDGGGKSNMEVDIYGGYKFSVGDVAYDIGFLRYEYANNDLPVSANTNEFYGAVTMGPTTLKYSQSTGNLFGFAGSKGSSYVDLTANFDLGSGFTLTPHLGYQKVKGAGNGIYSYTDLALTVAKDLGNGLTASAALIGTDAKTGSYVSPAGKQLGKAGLVVGVKYAF